MAMKREIETLKKDNKRLTEVLGILKSSSESRASELLKQLRLTTADPAVLFPAVDDISLELEFPQQVARAHPTTSEH